MEKASLASLMSVDARDLFSAFPGPAGLYCVCVCVGGVVGVCIKASE